MKCDYGVKFYSTWFLRDNLKQKLQVFSCFHQRFQTWSIAFTSSIFICHLFILFNNYYISLHQDSLKMNKNSINKIKYDFIADKDSVKKTKHRIPTQRKYFLRCKWLLQIYLYHLWHLHCPAGSDQVFIKEWNLILSFISKNQSNFFNAAFLSIV